MSNTGNTEWHAVVLAAGRGPDDSMARAFSMSHKCMIEIAGETMLSRVVSTLDAHSSIGSISVVTDEPAAAKSALGAKITDVELLRADATAAASAHAAATRAGFERPVLITTADHVLLSAQILDHFLEATIRSDADLTAGLASAETILAAYPQAKRTFLRFGPDRVSGCNLFGLTTDRALAALEFWQRLEQDRKSPVKLVRAFGLVPLIRYLTGTLDLQSAFSLASGRLGLKAVPVLLPFANAAIDVDKPADKELVEQILGPD